MGMAVVSVPVTVFAGYYADNEFRISGYGVIGDYSYSSSSSSSSYYSYLGLLAVGNYHNYNLSNANGSLLVGSYCNLYDPYSVVIGSWNKDTTNDERFVIGNGVSSNTKRNVMEIYKNGTVKIGYPSPGTSSSPGSSPANHAIEISSDGKTIRINRQGDISMGNYEGS